NEGIHGISGSEIGEHRATARHPGNTAIVHFFAGRDVPGSAWEEPERDEHQLALGAAHPRHAIRTRPAFIRTRGGCSYNGLAPVGAPQRVLLRRAGSVGAPPSVRTGPAHIRTRGGCSYPDSAPVGAPPSVRTWASTFSHPTRVLLPRFRPCRYSVKGQAFMCSSLNNCEESKAVSSLMHAHIPVRYFLITAHWACIFFLPRDTSAS